MTISKITKDGRDQWATTSLRGNAELHDTHALAVSALQRGWAVGAQQMCRLLMELQILTSADEDSNIDPADLDAIVAERLFEARNLAWNLGINGPLTLLAIDEENSDLRTTIDGETVGLDVDVLAKFAIDRHVAAQAAHRARLRDRSPLHGMTDTWFREAGLERGGVVQQIAVASAITSMPLWAPSEATLAAGNPLAPDVEAALRAQVIAAARQAIGHAARLEQIGTAESKPAAKRTPARSRKVIANKTARKRKS